VRDLFLFDRLTRWWWWRVVVVVVVVVIVGGWGVEWSFVVLSCVCVTVSPGSPEVNPEPLISLCVWCFSCRAVCGVVLFVRLCACVICFSLTGAGGRADTACCNQLRGTRTA